MLSIRCSRVICIGAGEEGLRTVAWLDKVRLCLLHELELLCKGLVVELLCGLDLFSELWAGNGLQKNGVCGVVGRTLE